MSDFYPEKIFERAEVFDAETCMKIGFEFTTCMSVITGKHDVIDINEQCHKDVSFSISE